MLLLNTQLHLLFTAAVTIGNDDDYDDDELNARTGETRRVKPNEEL